MKGRPEFFYTSKVVFKSTNINPWILVYSSNVCLWPLHYASYINIREQCNSYYDASPTNRSDWALRNNKIICKCYSQTICNILVNRALFVIIPVQGKQNERSPNSKMPCIFKITYNFIGLKMFLCCFTVLFWHCLCVSVGLKVGVQDYHPCNDCI